MDAPSGRLREDERLTAGWRYWQLAGPDRLRSISHRRVEWPADRPLRAFCMTGAHPSPSEGCNCGIYAAVDLPSLRRQRLCFTPGPLVVGEVELSGRLVVSDDGLRGEYARPLSLSLVVDTLPPGTEHRLHDVLGDYGVPVGTTTLAEAVGDVARAVLANQLMSSTTESALTGFSYAKRHGNDAGSRTGTPGGAGP